MSKKSTYPAVFYPWDDGRGYTVEVPDLPGCVSEGEDLATAIEMAEDAASGWIVGELEDGKEVPSPSRFTEIIPEEDAFVQYLVLDISEYSRKYGKKVVKKNLTIPAWLATRAQEQNVNFSKVLQDALIEKMHLQK